MSQKQIKVALLHHTGGGNLGDDASLDVVISNIQRRWPRAAITVFSMNPDDTAKKHGVPSHPIRRYEWGIGYKSDSSITSAPNKYRFIRWLQTTSNLTIRIPRAMVRELAFLITSRRILKNFAYLVVTGGGQLTERSGPWGFPYGIWIWLRMAKSVHLQCIFLNVGAGPLRHPLSAFFVRHALFTADYVSFRDGQSQMIARDLGYSGRSQVFPDNVYSLELVPPQASHPRPAAPIAGIAPMPYPFCDPREHSSANLQAIYEDYIAKIAAFCASLAKNSYSIEFFGSDVGVDASAIEDVQTVLRNRHNLVTPAYEQVQSVRGLVAKMAAMDYVVTCRFHGVVFAHLLNKPVLAISHHPKVATLMNDLGLSKYCVEIHNFRPDQLAEVFQSLVSNTQEIKSTMAASLGRYKCQLAMQLDELFPVDRVHTSISTRPESEGRERIAVGESRL